MDIILATPRGFCAGVNRAIAIVHQALERYRPPVYVLHEIVHNTHVIEELRRRGAVFVEELEQIPRGAVAIFSAHGVSRAVEDQARALGLRTIDATCPLVSKVHRRMNRLHAMGYDVLVIGHKKHPEVEGTCGQASGPVHVLSTPAEIESLQVADPAKVGYVTQTTLSVDDTAELLKQLRLRFPLIAEPERTDICYATTNRQAAVRQLADMVDLVLIVGSKNSSNSNRLREVARNRHTPAFLIDDADEIDPAWFAEVRRVGISAGASAPEHLVVEVVRWLQEHGGAGSVTEMDGQEEHISFPVPDLLDWDL
ncbi:MAG: 4-hydroxy-3-methylbut-2-enyl diphosphate reductase [Desulfobulbus sp.]|jgi:4-hydroxy-3-methylbut-2-enyl diphosphate reductase|uniref:4-hydroxy-3-methylbut-2-enyl diphosphate reductase n=1 Tax=Desulfobulbus sp. TaxID=895 RepID=UPI002849AB79|nr:4-hydroxy-3-methylbut-2-enyl diphosphate reductase [Desulfobulbus sp.]MDR2549845.1 4-hydroxy-3-methylbut-2-enyl diphosphate reductase [Desulfobulbus sp.]